MKSIRVKTANAVSYQAQMLFVLSQGRNSMIQTKGRK